MTSLSLLTLLSLGLVFGLKHAGEVDHVVAVSTIVSQHRDVFRSAIVGGLWGLGHTATLLIVGALVLVFRVGIAASVAGWLEFGVAVMIIILGATGLLRVSKSRGNVHVHRHRHDGLSHVHIHFHDQGTQHPPNMSHSHKVSRIDIKPILVGAMHGLAGSAALTLLVLSQVDSIVLGILYLACFGAGATVGMLVMSGLIGLPFVLSAGRLTGLNHRLQMVAGVLTIAFGFWYAFDVGRSNDLWGMVF
jgi:ABC-type nickel/cobalt efflux system permease component RcnA